jgi:fibronectin-binding autotransporter adhesin
MKNSVKTSTKTVQFLLVTALLALATSAFAQSGTWTNLVNGNASGSWATAANWLNGVVAGGADSTADFSTLDITNATATVTLDGSRTIGNLIIGDTVPDTNWTFNAGTPSTSALTLAVSAGVPVINVSNRIATFGAAIFSSNGFLKTGAGTLRLNNSDTNASGWLNGLVIVSNGVLQCGNSTFGISGNQNGTNRVVVTNGATLEVIPGIAVNNKHLTISGSGLNGTQGAIYANPATNTSSTRWGLSSVNDSGVSGNSSATFPAITLAADSTIRVDGNNFTYVLIGGYITSGTNNFALTKTGSGKLSLDRGANVSNIVVNAGSVAPNSASGFGAVQTWTINNGGTILNWQNGCYGSGASMTVNAGGVWDINGRSDSAGTGYTETIGFLSGNGTITHGMNGANVATVLAVNNNGVFNGTIQVANGVLHLTKNTAGTTLQLTGTNTYNGITTINGGTLLVDGAHTGGSNYVVNAGATLGGKGTILPTSGNVINLSGTMVAGDNGGTLSVSNVLGAGDVVVSNANLTVFGQLNTSASGNFLNSLYLTNSTTTILLQQNGTEASIYTSALNVDGANILSFTTANPATGVYPFIKCFSIGGLDGFAGLQLQPPAGMGGYLSNNVVNDSTIYVVITNIPALVWRGTPTGDWTIGGSANWLNGATPTAYTETAGQGPFVIFDNTATGTTSVNVAADVDPKGITVNSSSGKDYTFSGTGAITTSGSIVKDGSSTLTLANTNSLSGSISVLNGALAIGNGGTSGSIGTATVANSGQVIFNRSDDVTFPNAISGAGSLVKNNSDTVTLTGVGNIGGAITANAGTLALGPSGTITVSGDITGSGGFGINSTGKVILSSANITYSGGSLIAGGGTLEFDNAFPPSGNINDNGTLALGIGGTFSGNISGSGGVTLLNFASVTLSGANSYTGPTRVLGSGVLTVDAANYSPASPLVLGSTNGAADVGSAIFTAGNPVLGGLAAGGNNSSGDSISLNAGSAQTLTINGNVYIGNTPSGASVYLPITGTSASLTVVTNGGVIQLGLGNTGSGVNPDNVFVDLSTLDNFTANLGTTGVINLGTLDGNPGPPGGATVVNWFNLASVSNSITTGAINIGAGGRQLTPELRLGAGTNIFNVNTLALGPGQGTGGRDGGYLYFLTANGGLRLRGNDGVSRAAFNVGVNPVTGTGANITNTVDFTGHPVDLLVSNLTIGDYNNAGIYQNTFSFDTGTLDAQSTSLSVIRNNNANAAFSGSTLNIGGGTALLGAVNLTASAAYGILNINNANVTVAGITSPGAGLATFTIANSTLNLNLTSLGNPSTAPIAVDSFSATGAVNLGVNGTNFVVGQFPLIGYSGSIGGDGYSALNLASLPSGVSGYLSNNVTALSVDLVITNAPAFVNTTPTNILTAISGNTLTLSWPSDHKGWHLQAQTNSTAVGLGTNWVTVAGSDLVTSTNFTINPANGAVFFRMVYP